MAYVFIYGSLSTLSVDIGENKCGTVMVNLEFFITFTLYDK